MKVSGYIRNNFNKNSSTPLSFLQEIDVNDMDLSDESDDDDIQNVRQVGLMDDHTDVHSRVNSDIYLTRYFFLLFNFE